MKKTKKEIKEWLLENCLDEEGNLDLSGLDFSDFNGDVKISRMRVQKNLYQGFHIVQGTLSQTFQIVKGNLLQQNHEVNGDLDQSGQVVNGNLSQFCQEVGGNLRQHLQMVEGTIETYKPTGEEIVEDQKDYLIIKKTKEITDHTWKR